MHTQLDAGPARLGISNYQLAKTCPESGMDRGNPTKPRVINVSPVVLMVTNRLWYGDYKQDRQRSWQAVLSSAAPTNRDPALVCEDELCLPLPLADFKRLLTLTRMCHHELVLARHFLNLQPSDGFHNSVEFVQFYIPPYISWRQRENASCRESRVRPKFCSAIEGVPPSACALGEFLAGMSVD